MNAYEQSGIMKDCKTFLTKIEKLKLYIMEFKEVDIMKPKAYFSDCVAKGDERQFIIIIVYDK